MLDLDEVLTALRQARRGLIGAGSTERSPSTSNMVEEP